MSILYLSLHLLKQAHAAVHVLSERQTTAATSTFWETLSIDGLARVETLCLRLFTRDEETIKQYGSQSRPVCHYAQIQRSLCAC